ncbi:MAG: AzlD domain-containing protein [Spirochaetaceae bacterium]
MPGLTSTELWAVIVAMGLVTYLPRMAPMVAVNAEKLPARLVRMLKNIPYAALGALIFPGILSINDNILYGIIGGLVAAGAAYLKLHLVLVVIISIAAVTLTAQVF